ncbi:MAG: type II toxin-antitoxin system YafQ family toxin [Desulfamplus sp.]|nr:type II toxin-antitoxin system YafQ family toxin [Desulfamplus sp.]
MLKPVYSKRFERDVKRIVKRGKNVEKLKEIIRRLIHKEILEKRYCNHPLKGDYNDCFDCHIEPDWILIYRTEEDYIQFLRTGSHADLFK